MSVEQGPTKNEVPSKPKLVDSLKHLFRRQDHQLQTVGAGAFPTPTSTFDQDQFGPDISKVQAPPFPQQPVRRGGESLPKGVRPEHPLITRRNFLKAGGATAIALGLTAFGLNNLPRSGGTIATPTESPRPTDSPTPTVKATPTPSEAPTPGPTPTPSVVETPSPTPVVTESPIPTPTPTESPKPTPIKTVQPTPSPTESPKPTATPEKPKTLDEILTDWVGGKIKIPDSKMYIERFGGKGVKEGPIVPLGMFDKKIGTDKTWRPALVGYILGQEIVNNHQIVYVGFKDKKGGHFFVPYNYGEINDLPYGTYWLNTNREFFASGNLHANILTTSEMRKYWSKIVGSTATVTARKYEFHPSPAISASTLKEEVNSIPLAKDFINWMNQLYNNGSRSYKNLPTTDLLRRCLNKRVSKFNAKNILFDFAINTHV